MEAQQIRKSKMGGKQLQRSYGYKIVPWLNIATVWLEKANFKEGDPLHIKVSKGKLVITNPVKQQNKAGHDGKSSLKKIKSYKVGCLD